MPRQRKEAKKASSTPYQTARTAAAAIIKASIDAPTSEWAAVVKSEGAPDVPWSEELGAKLAELVIEGKSIQRISKIAGTPKANTMYKWIADIRHPFHAIYRDSKQIMVTLYEEDIIDIADTPMLGEIVTERAVLDDNGKIVILQDIRRQDMLGHRAMQIGARQTTLAWLKPKKHGRVPDMGAAGKNEQLEALFQALKRGPAE